MSIKNNTDCPHKKQILASMSISLEYMAIGCFEFFIIVMVIFIIVIIIICVAVFVIVIIIGLSTIATFDKILTSLNINGQIFIYISSRECE